MGLVVPAVPLQAPAASLDVEVRQFHEDPSRKEVFLHGPDEPLRRPFGEWVPRPAELRLETDRVHEPLVVLLPDRAPASRAPDNDALHVVGEDVSGDAHHLECMDHADEQVLLPGVREELHGAHATVVADHHEAGQVVGLPGHHLHIDEAPVHLVAVAGRSGVPTPTVAQGETTSLGAGTRSLWLSM